MPDSTDGARPERPSFIAGFLPVAAPAEDAAGATRPQLPLPYARVTLAGGDVVVAGPDGYCIDPTTVDRGAARAFAMLASCRILSSGRAGFPVEPLLMTVTVGPRGAVDDLPDAEGLAELAGAPMIAGETAIGLTTVNLAHGGDTVLSGGDERYWRATFLQGGRLVGLALYAPEGSPMAGPEGETMLLAVRDRIASLSPKGNAVAPADARVEAAGVGSLLGRLFDRQNL